MGVEGGGEVVWEGGSACVSVWEGGSGLLRGWQAFVWEGGRHLYGRVAVSCVAVFL